MSNDKSKKDTPQEHTSIFTIESENTNTSEVPDIASLLGNSRKTKKPRPTNQDDKTEKTVANTLQVIVRSLKEFDTSIEIHFMLKENEYRYLQHDFLSNQKQFGLEEIFQNMKIPQSLIADHANFIELNIKDRSYVFDAFGITEQPYMEIILHQNMNFLTVYFSGKSMAKKKDAVIQFTEQKNKNLNRSGLHAAS
jgi:hypothetical protein